MTIPIGSSELLGYFESRRGVRIAGWTLVAAAAVTGIALMATAHDTHEQCVGPSLCQTVHGIDFGQAIAGTTVLFAGTAIGVVMGLTRDVPHIDAHGAPNPPSNPQKAPGVVVTGGF